MECKKMLLEAMVEAGRFRKNFKRQEGVSTVLQELKPFEFDFIEYEKGKEKGVGWHEDAYCLLRNRGIDIT